MLLSHYLGTTITAERECIIERIVLEKATEAGCHVLAFNTVSDHAHLAISITPKVAVSKVIGSIKGMSAYAVNKTLDLENHFKWQKGYGVLTFGEKVRDFVVAYVQNQKHHHAEETTYEYLERFE